MERAATLSVRTRATRRELPDFLFRSVWAALVIPLLVPLVVLFW